jgi:hypothetical protein
MIHVIQCLCPERHCILAVAYDDAETKPDDAMQMFKSMVLTAADAGGPMNPWCGICQSRDWRYEDGVTRFASLEAAKPFLEQSQADQLATRTLIDEQRAARN